MTHHGRTRAVAKFFLTTLAVALSLAALGAGCSSGAAGGGGFVDGGGAGGSGASGGGGGATLEAVVQACMKFCQACKGDCYYCEFFHAQDVTPSCEGAWLKAWNCKAANCGSALCFDLEYEAQNCSSCPTAIRAGDPCTPGEEGRQWCAACQQMLECKFQDGFFLWRLVKECECEHANEPKCQL